MKFILILISFLFCGVLFAENRLDIDPSGEQVTVVAVTDIALDPPTTPLMTLTVELKFLDSGSTVVTQGISPPSNLSPIINNKEISTECYCGMTLLVTTECYQSITRMEPVNRINRLGTSSGGTSGNPVLKA